jgi:segregation and condensation protein B
MTYDDDGRSLAGLDARQTQHALAEEFAQGGAMTEDRPERPPGEAAASAPVAFSDEERAEHRRMAEAVLFAAVEPLDEAAIAARLPAGADVAAIIATLAADYAGRGVQLARVSGKWRFVTASDVAHVLATEQIHPRRLSRAALETLAIIAYHQPCTRADIEDVRGVAVSKGSLDMLLEIGWVRLRGRRKDAPGRPVLYGTSETFLEHFGLESVADLPGMADLKAAGLLDARLPPGFAVPTPADAGDADFDDEDEDGESSEFAQDFLTAGAGGEESDENP